MKTSNKTKSSKFKISNMPNSVNFMSQIKLLKKMFIWKDKREQAIELDKVMLKIYK